MNVEAINHKNDTIKKEIENLNKKKQQIDPNNDFKEYTIELLKKLDCTVENDEVIFRNKLGFTFIFDGLNRKSKLKEINIEYRTTLVNFANYPLIMFANSKIMEMDSSEQNKVALYLFNSINCKIKKYVNLDKILDNDKQVF